MKKVIQTQPFYLQAGIDGIQTSIVTSTITDIYGNQITSMPSGVSFLVATIEPRSPSNQESIKITAISDLGAGQVALTVVRKVEAVYPYAPLAGTVPHGNGSECIITNGGLIYEGLASKDEDNVFTAKNTFPSDADRPVLDADVDATIDEELVTFGQLARTSFAGTVDASTTVKGISEIATTAEINAGTSTGGTGASLVVRPDQLAASNYGTRLPTSGEKDALTGTSGTPGTTNKYVTNDDTSATSSAGKLVRQDANGRIPYGMTYSDYQSFTANGTWTKPTGLTGNEMVLVHIWGGGGAGAGVTGVGSPMAGGGGGGGSFVEAKFIASSLPATIAVTVAASVAGGTSHGSAGNSSSFGAYATAYGGGGGGSETSPNSGGGGGGGGVLSIGSSSTSATGASGGNPLGAAAGMSNSGFGGGGGGSGTSGGQSAYGGGGGGSRRNVGNTGGASIYGGGGGAGGDTGGSAVGGTSIFGGAGGNGRTGSAGNGFDGIAPGGGGGGALVTSGTQSGGAGARGEVRVWVLA